jgi:integrase
MPKREALFKATKLTEAAIAKFKPPTDRQYVNRYDAYMPGLVLRINSGGAKVWHVRYYVKGAVRTHRLERYPILKVAEAREKARKFRADPQKALAQADQGSFKEVAENFIKRHVDHNKLRSKKEIVRCLNTYVYPNVGKMSFAELKRSDIAKLLDKIVDEHGAVQADMVLAIISSICTFHQSRNNDYVSPIVKGMRRTKQKERARTRILDDDEIRAVWNAATECGPFGAMVKMLLLTGQRLRKVAHMQHADISDGVWAIRTEPREKGNPGSLRLPDLACDIIEAQSRIAGNPYVFVGRRGPINSFTNGKAELDHRVKKTLPGMRPWVLHDLRRTARSLLARRELNVLPHIAEQVLGHAIPGVAGIYDRHRYDDDKADALNKLAGLIEHILNPPKDNVVAMTRGRRKKGTR